MEVLDLNVPDMSEENMDEQLASTIANELDFCPFIKPVLEWLDAFEARRQKREQAAAAPRVYVGI